MNILFPDGHTMNIDEPSEEAVLRRALEMVVEDWLRERTGIRQSGEVIRGFVTSAVQAAHREIVEGAI